MRKLNLVAMSYDRDAILNALRATGAVEIKPHAECADSYPLPKADEEISLYLAELEKTLESLTAETETYGKDHQLKLEIPKDGFEVSYDEFISAYTLKQQADDLVEKVNALLLQMSEYKAALSKCERALAVAEPYAKCRLLFSSFKGTAHTAVFTGLVSTSALGEIKNALLQNDLTEYTELCGNSDATFIGVVTHKSVAEEIDGVLRGKGFTPCPYTEEQSGEELFQALKAEKKEILKNIDLLEKELFELGKEHIRMLKLYCDYIGLEREKAEQTEKLRGTQRTFLLEAYVPKTAEEQVRAALSEVGCVFLEFSDPTEEETPPTLLKNNGLVEPFEAVTNMYSTPTYREFDPNAIMSVFYAVFLGFIMADFVYGLLMFLGGGAIYLKTRARKSGLSRLSAVFAIGGLFAVVWGVLFNSFCGIALLPFTVMPDAQNDFWTFLGISVPAMLVVAMLLGVVHLGTGYFCRAFQSFRRGLIADGILDGVVWVCFSLGVGVAVVGSVAEFNLGFLQLYGGIAAAAFLVIAMLTAGRKEKIFGKFTKGFGTLYGIINYVSDLLSYSRLFGLMLSGAAIAQLVSQYALQFMASSVPLAILGVFLMIVGHAANLAISLLGAYIHDARLQYVEFYGRFFEGDGELFMPLGARHTHVWVAPKKAASAETENAALQTV